jgi:hypothetical protein
MLPQRHHILVLHAIPTAPRPCTSCYLNDTAFLYFMLLQQHRILVLQHEVQKHGDVGIAISTRMRCRWGNMKYKDAMLLGYHEVQECGVIGVV